MNSRAKRLRQDHRRIPERHLGHRRKLDVGTWIPPRRLSFVMTNVVWEENYVVL